MGGTTEIRKNPVVITHLRLSCNFVVTNQRHFMNVPIFRRSFFFFFSKELMSLFELGKCWVQHDWGDVLTDPDVYNEHLCMNGF